MTVRQLLTIAPTWEAGNADVHTIHRAVMSGFAAHMQAHDKTPRSDLMVLYSIQSQQSKRTAASGRMRGLPEPMGAPVKLLVQAETAGDWSQTPGIAAVEDLGEVTYDFATGDRLSIRAILNPVRSACNIKTRDGGREQVKSTRTVHRHDLGQWAEEKFARIGLELDPELALGAALNGTGYKPKDDGSVTALSIRYQPIVATGTVTDAQALAEALRRGVGKGRAYGCGLVRHTTMSTARP